MTPKELAERRFKIEVELVRSGTATEFRCTAISRPTDAAFGCSMAVTDQEIDNLAAHIDGGRLRFLHTMGVLWDRLAKEPPTVGLRDRLLESERMLAEANAQCEEQRLRIAALDSANGKLVSRVHELEAELCTAAWAGG